MAFGFQRLKIPEVVRIRPQRLGDQRGFFSELYKASEFSAFGIPRTYCQVNGSRSGGGVLRGLHYQIPPMAQAKLVRVLSGRIYDAAVDLRQGSPSFGQYVGIELDEVSGDMLFIPEGFAHGFCVLSESADIEYFCSNEYSKAHERGVRFDDPAIGVAWPVKKPLISEKDLGFPALKEADRPFHYEK